MTIHSPQNPRVKAAARLRERRQRQKQQRYLIDGAREILRALAADVPVVEAFVCPELCRSDDSRQAAAMLDAAAADVLEVTPAVFGKLAFGERAEGLLVVARSQPRTLERLALAERPLVAVLEGIEKPGNVGAVLRTADAAGLSAVIVADPATDLENPNCIRASLGAVFTLPVAVADTAAALAWLRRRQIAVHAARVDAELPYTSADFTGPAAVALGSEAHGLSPQWHAPDIVPIRLPMHGVVDSLNVSAAAAVLFYEAVRQRQPSP